MVVHKKILKSIPLGVIFYKGKIGFLETDIEKNNQFYFSWGENGTDFVRDNKKVYFSSGLVNHKPEQTSNFRFSNSSKKLLATYTRTVGAKKYDIVAEARSLYEWEVVSETLSQGYESLIVPDLKFKSNFIKYEGGSFVRCLISKDLKNWDDNNSLLFTNRHGRFDKDNINLIGTYNSEKGIVIFYSSLEYTKDSYKPHIGVVLADQRDPYRKIWQMEDSIWKSDIVFSLDTEYRVLGMVSVDSKVYAFFCTNSIIITVCIDTPESLLKIPAQPHKLFIKHKKNPVISPHPTSYWDSEGALNPATIKDDDGYVHLLYRAIGSDGVSRIGYNFSKDGLKFQNREPEPIFAMLNPRKKIKREARKYDPVMYTSGGSWGGCEDPRAVRIDGKIYVTFNAFDGWDFIRIAVISIDEKDFFNKKWEWSNPILISPEKEINKNWVLFPEKIKGKFAILHSISPNVQIDYIEDLEDLNDGTKTIKSTFKQDKSRVGWDTWVRGVGPPPIKTDKGWLVLYHGMDHMDPNKYKLGAMLLDLKDPNKVLARSNQPLISPDKWYESDWKPGVIYACGAVVKDGTLFVYYGGGDKHVCVATAPLNAFLADLIKNK